MSKFLELVNVRSHKDFLKNSQKKDMYIGRWHPRFPINSIWGNPYKGERLRVIALFDNHFQKNGLSNNLEELLDYDRIGCWCRPEPCHGMVLLRELCNQYGCERIDQWRIRK